MDRVKGSALKLDRGIEPKVLKTLTGHESVVYSLIHLGEGRIASGSDPTIKLWDLASGTCEKTLTGHEGFVRSLVHLGEGRIASASYDKTIKLWDVASGICEKTLTDHKDGMWSLIYLGEGRIASGSGDGKIKLWNVASGTCEKTLIGHKSAVFSIIYLGNGRIASGSQDRTIKLWDVASGTCEKTLVGHSDWVGSLLHLDEGRIASGSKDQTIKLWDVASGTCEKTLTGHKDGMWSLIYLGEGRIASGSSDDTIKLWDVVSGSCEKTLMGHEDVITSLINLGEGMIVSGSGDKTIKLWDTGYRAEKKVEGPLRLEGGREEPFWVFHPTVPEAAVIASAPAPQAISESLSQMTLSSASDQSGSRPSPSAPLRALAPSIASTDIKVGDRLGEGGFGVVYKGSWQRVKVAIKQLRATKLTEKTLTSFREEVSLHGALRHPNVVTLYGACLEVGRYSMVMELMSGGSLYELLHSTQALLWSVRKNIAENIAVGLSYLHAHNIIHRDLKSLNVLLDAHLSAKLADFGLSSIKSETQSTMTVSTVTPGTTRWKAPELFKRGAKCNEASDIYAMGYVFWELSSRKVPFQDEDAADDMTISMWVKEGERDDIPSDCPAQYAEIIRKCWAQDPRDRPNSAELVADELEALEITSNLSSGYAYFSK